MSIKKKVNNDGDDLIFVDVKKCFFQKIELMKTLRDIWVSGDKTKTYVFRRDIPEYRDSMKNTMLLKSPVLIPLYCESVGMNNYTVAVYDEAVAIKFLE